MVCIHCTGVPSKALPMLARTLEEYGAKVAFESETKGMVEHDAGRLSFEHSGVILTVVVEHNAGHFPTMLLVGGVKQLVSETVELLLRRRAQA
jgi:hypothetical protein